MSKRYQSFEEFWPFYLGQHRNRVCRGLHLWGTTLGLVTLVYGLSQLAWWAFPAALVVGYGHSWVGHFFFERNKPATFQYPLWSFLGDWKMMKLFYTGKLGAEVERLFGSRNPSPDAPLRADR